MAWYSAPKPDPALGAAAAESAALGREALDFSKQQYEEMKPYIMSILQTDSDIQKQAAEQGKEMYDYWKSTYLPMEKGLVADAAKYDEAGYKETFAQKAAGDIEQQYAQSRGQLTRNLGRYGINPSSGAFANLNAQLQRDEALQKAGAMTGARVQADQLGWARKLDVAGLGRGMAGAANAAYGVAVGAGRGAQDATGQGSAIMMPGYSSAQQGMGNAMRGYGMDFDARMQGYGAKMGLIGDFTKAAGMGAATLWGPGGFLRAEGGEVEGPGGPKDDTVPAMLSDGEYVVPASVVKKLGVGHFDKLIAKHGDEGNKKALAARKGLKGRA